VAPSVPAVGFAVGLERVSIDAPGGIIASSNECLYYVAAFGEEGISLDLYFSTNSVESEFLPNVTIGLLHWKGHLAKPIGRSAVTHLLGDDEAARGSVILRNPSRKLKRKLLVGLTSL